MAVIQSVAFFGLFLTGLASAQSPQCNSTAVDTCLAPFQPWSDGFALGTVTAANISTACSSYTDTVSCVLTKANCPDSDPITMAKWLGKKQVVGYCCADGKNDYLANQVCLANSQFLQGLGACGIQTPINSSLPDVACTSLSTKLNCISVATQRTCNTSTTAFMNKIAPMLLSPAVRVNAPSCTGQCNATAMSMCLAAFSNVSDGFVRSIYNASTLDGACSAVTNMSSCALSANCTDTDAITMATGWTGKKFAVNNNCFVDRAGYLANQPCMSTPAFVAALGSCVGTPVAPGLDPTTACRQFNTQIACMGPAINATCGVATANAMLRNAPGFLGPAFKVQYPNCLINTPALLGGSGIGGSGAAFHWTSLSLLLASLLAALFV